MNVGGVFVAADGRLRAGWRAAFGVVVFAVAELLAGGAASFAPDVHPLVVEAISRSVALLVLLAGFALLLVAADGVEERPLASMGLGWSRGARRQIIWGIAAGTAMVTTCAGVIFATSSVASHFSFNLRGLAHALLSLSVLAVAAMAEEATFRGYPFQRLVEGTGPVAAVALTSTLFGLIHAGNPNVSRFAVGNTVLFGILLAVAYLRSGALWLPWGIHFGWNAMLGVGFGLPVSGVTLFAAVLRLRPAGPAWITGGAYGIEGGGLATIVIALAIPAVYWLGGCQPFAAENIARAAEPPPVTEV